MMRATVVSPLLLLVAAVASANTYTVTSNADSGWGTLRMAIQLANSHPGPDLIRFAIPARLTHTILPQSPLPALTDEATTIDGGANDDGTPVVLIDGNLAGAASGLTIKASECTVRGVALGRFEHWLILIGATHARVAGCWLGVKPNGTALSPGWGAVRIVGDGNTIGGTSAADRNIILPGSTHWITGVFIDASSGNVVSGNYIGVGPDGQQTYGTTGTGVRVRAWWGATLDNRIGGVAPGSGNVFGGLNIGVVLEEATDTTIQGNLFGLAADGDTLLPLSTGLHAGGATGTSIGGTTAGARNVFAGGVDSCAVAIVPSSGADPSSATIRGNYFGTNQAGTETRSLGTGVSVADPGASVTIGGGTAKARNYFTPTGNPAVGVVIGNGAGVINIRRNKFGCLPAAGDVTGMFRGVWVQTGARAAIRDNTFTGWFEGVYARDYPTQAFGTEVSVFGNLFRRCTRAVAISGVATGHLGNLANANTNDDGGNTFKLSNDWFISNPGHNDLKAEGNDFSTTLISKIEAKIYDQLDCPFAGRVDYVPLAGGVIPTAAERASLAITGAAVTPTPRGAEIVWTLSAPAQVTIRVLNLAGRPVATICRARDCDAGANTLLWDARSDAGLSVPNGTYLIEVAAKTEDGSQARALGQVRISR